MNNVTNQSGRQYACRERGIVTVIVALLLITGVIFVLQQSHGIIGTTSQSNDSQFDSIAAFFLAESGVEVSKSLISSGGATESTACTSVSTGSSSLGRGAFTLAGVPSKGGVANSCVSDCDTCTVTATGTVGDAKRKIQVTFSVSSPSGGAAGCGGGGTNHVGCPVPNVTPVYTDINQSITVTELNPVILFSNVGFVRHPVSNSNNINADECVAEPGGSQCTTQWNVESSTSAGQGVVGSRGSAALVTPSSVPTTYELQQTLTADSLFAGIAAKVGGSGLTVIGSGDVSYWDDSSNNGDATVAGNATAYGKTNNGAGCTAPAGTATCPNSSIPAATIPDPPSAGSMQASRSWCYDADTLMFGLAGKSSNNANGTINSFRFGSSTLSARDDGISSKPVPTPGSWAPGVVPFPTPSGTQNSEVYASLRYVYNKTYLSDANASSGGKVQAMAGIPDQTGVFDASVSGTTLTINTNTNGRLIFEGDEARCDSNGAGCTSGKTVGLVTGSPCTGGFPCACKASPSGVNETSLPCDFTLNRTADANRPTAVQIDSTITNSGRLAIWSKWLQVVAFNTISSVKDGWLSEGDWIKNSGVNVTVTSIKSPTATTVFPTIANVPETHSDNGSDTTCTNNPASPKVNPSFKTCQSAPAYYELSEPVVIALGVSPNQYNIEANGYTIHLASGSVVPDEGTIVEARNTGNVSYTLGSSHYQRACIASATALTQANGSYALTATLFYLNQYVDTGDPDTSYCGTAHLTNGPTTSGATANGTVARLIDNQICGGICAFFNHQSGATGTTKFTVGIVDTDQWAGGMACLKGVDPSTIEGLYGTDVSVTQTGWHELVEN